MATPLTYTARYDHPAAAVRAAISDEAYWKDRIAAVGGPNARLESVSVTGDRATIAMIQSIAAELLPAAVTAVRPGDLVIPRTENWDGHSGTFNARVEGAPAEVSGTISLVDDDEGSIAGFDGTAEVNIPMFGGKIEAAIAERLVELIGEETEFTNSWLAEH